MADINQIENYDFSNILIDLARPEHARFSTRPLRGLAENSRACRPFPKEYGDALRSFAANVKSGIEEHSQKNNGVEFGEITMTMPKDADTLLQPDAIRLRVVWQKTAFGATMAVCRRLDMAPSSLSDLGIHPEIEKKLHELGTRPGSVIFAGDTSAGKTTTMMAMIADSIHVNGGLAYLIETSPEIDMSGDLGPAGMCVQFQIKNGLDEDAWIVSSTAALKWNPALVAFGEVGHFAPARAYIRMANSGRTVMTTTHSKTISEAAHRIASLAAERGGDYKDYIARLSSSLSAIVFQKMTPVGPEVSILDVSGNSHQSTALIGHLRNDEYDKIEEHVISQATATTRPVKQPVANESGSPRLSPHQAQGAVLAGQQQSSPRPRESTVGQRPA